MLERAGAGLYRQLAASEADPAVREELLRSAEREEANAATLSAHPRALVISARGVRSASCRAS